MLDSSTSPRARLFATLSSTTPLVVLQGNRFAGKTVLARSWLLSGAEPDAIVVPMTAPAGTSTPDEYWTDVLSAVHARTGATRPERGPASFQTLCSLFSALQHQIVLILDAVDRIHGIEPHVAALLDLCPHLRVLVTTRTTGKWQQVTDTAADRTILSATELACTDVETATILNAAAVPQSQRTVQWITRRTTGLPALIDAVRESLQQHSAGSLEIVVDDLDKLVDDSIDRAVLRALDDPDLTPLRRSILASSTLTALPEESSNIERSDFALSGVSDIVAFTHTMIAAGFLDPSPDTGEDGYPRKWCYPEPVRASLRRIAEDRHPTDLRATETATIDALLHAGKPHAALTYAIDGGQWERALHIVDEHWTTLYTGGFLDTLGAALVERIPAEIADTHPTSRAIRRLHRQFSAPRDVPVVTAEPDVADGIGPEPAEVVMRAVMLRIDGRFLEAAKACDAASDHPLPVFDELDEHTRNAYAFYYLHVGITYLLVDRTDDATAMFRRAHVAGTGTFIERDAAGKLALTSAMEGALVDTHSWIAEERRHPPPPGDSEKLVRTAGCVAAALAALDELEPDTALDILTELGTPADNEEFWAYVLYTRGHHALLTGMPTDGLRFVESHLQRYPTLRTGGHSATLIDTVLADLHLACGNPERAEDLIATSTHPSAVPVRARARLLAADSAGAQQIVDRWYFPTSVGPVRTSMELAVLGAATAAALDDVDAARRHLERAVTLSRHTGMLRPFVLLPSASQIALADLGVELPLDLNRTARNFATFPVYRPMLTLTARERAVLDALLTGKTITAIAASHFVSANTVKTQLRSLYRKLGVHNRKDAVAAARRLHLD
ncbi:helix-turn-helix transcriptional regulator [Rhodococcus rhodochrous]|uniref:helix-turn-helix transcriptional regulator n=1 Tax=Rhodococcus rhodochrous TaxID=1829 RepID=UPI00132F4BA9|nr:LuxR C-terminal-related transcriptional regulator [Rhodococcus rhodochrous]QHG83547.1 helix-turn-helix transcriptional regulator [Rhodococcus rhodochrous]QOH56775.1 helix-turn-helix transcriptional regulator [Rhodococcus rhodochrous]